ncbi:MAG: 2-hydroxychromene-2-carboxylate isomerase [Pseudomonadota bacterium]
MPALTFWYEFASTYSYLSAMRIEEVCRDAGIDLRWRPFLLGPIFKAQGWDSSPFNLYPAKGAYMWRDMERLTAAQGLPEFRKPDVFPQNGLLAARVATLGADEPWGAEFTRAVYQGQFADGATISDVGFLTSILSGIGLDAAHVLERAQTDAGVKARLRASTEAAVAVGVFGAPSFTTDDGELFWGDDRLDQAVAWAFTNDVG